MDRGYNPAQELIASADRGVGVVVRYNPPSLNGYDEAKTKIDGYEELQKTTETERCVPVRVQVNGQLIEGDVHACRLPPAPATEARQRVRARAEKKGRRAQPRTLALAEWVLVLTTLPPAWLSTATVLALYRVHRPRRATPWRVWKRLRQELATAISGVVQWNLKYWSACLEVIPERPRRRQLQTLPDRVNRLIAFCQANGLSNI